MQGNANEKMLEIQRKNKECGSFCRVDWKRKQKARHNDRLFVAMF
jgi:hypothetical protein